MAETAMAVQGQMQVARSTGGGLAFNSEQRKMIREMYAPGANESEFGALIAIAEARGLNPLLKQVYFVKRWDSNKRAETWAVQGSIDGLRAIAQRTGLYDGQDEPEFEYEAGGAIRLARVKVYRKDWARPAVGVARWSEYAQTKKDGGLTSFWLTKGHVMLAKCAEALGLRKAFPEDMGGIYVPEELDEQRRAEVARDVTPPTAPALRGVVPDEPAHDAVTGEVHEAAPAAAAETPADPPTPPAEGAALAGLLAEITAHDAFNAKQHADNWWKQHWETIAKLPPKSQREIRKTIDAKIKPANGAGKESVA